MPMRYAENSGYKNGHFRFKKNLRFFLYFDQNKDRGYRLELQHWGGCNIYQQSTF